MEVIKLVTGINRTNTYILISSGEAIVIDPGAEPNKILDRIKDRNAELKYIFLTHAHFDHVGAVYKLKTDGVKIYMSRTDAERYDEIYNVGNEDIYVPAFAVDGFWSDGDEFSLLGSNFKILQTPGHTPGSVCIVMDDRTIFSGDTLFRLGVGRTDFPGGDRAAQCKSLQKLFALEHDYEVLPGHGENTELYFERDKNPYAR